MINGREAVVNALRERQARQQLRRPAPRPAIEILSDAQERLSRIPVKDGRTADEILGYDAEGLPR